MKSIKPQSLALFAKTYENHCRFFASFSLVVFFRADSQPVLLSEVGMWKLLPQELGAGSVFDVWMPKLHGELIVCGSAYPPGGIPQPHCCVRVRLGKIDKTLHVHGNRRWSFGGIPTTPEPFTAMSISYANAFGGVGYPQNPVGKGFRPVKTEAGEVHLLPNIEEPRYPIQGSSDQPPPAGFGPYDFTWPQRFSKVGTYDKRWLEDRFPAHADDMDWTIWNAAPQDQQIDGFFQGDERFRIENMHPNKPVVEGVLPGVTTRCFVNQKTQQGEVFREIPTRLDTVWLFPHAERGILVFRGVIEVAEDDASDVLQVIAACEDMRAPKTEEHYQAVLARRMDRKKAHLYALCDSELLPAERSDRPPAPSDFAEYEKLLANQGLLRKNMRRRQEHEHELARQKLVKMGVDPAQHLPPLPAEEPLACPQSPEEIAPFVERIETMAEEQKALLEIKKAEGETRARELCKKNGVDFDKMMAPGRKGGPPQFSADAELSKIHQLHERSRTSGLAMPEVEEMLRDPAFAERLRATESQIRETYQKQAHHFPSALPMESAQQQLWRRKLEQKGATGDFAERDLTGIDLAGWDLRGFRLRGACLEMANLTGADLRGADLRGAVLARASLSAANLSGAELAGCNLGKATLHGARLDGCDLSKAVLFGADLTAASLQDTVLNGVELMEATLVETDLSRAKGHQMIFLKNDFSRAKCVGADFTKGTFIETAMLEADFSQSTLTSAVLVTAKGDGACFRTAKLDNLRVVKDSSFERADFSESNLSGANLRGTRLRGSNFAKANLSSADLSECDLWGANLKYVLARESRFAKADLKGAMLTDADFLNAILQKADLRGTDLSRTNLFGADLFRVQTDALTSFSGSNRHRARIVKRREQVGEPHGSR